MNFYNCKRTLIACDTCYGFCGTCHGFQGSQQTQPGIELGTGSALHPRVRWGTRAPRLLAAYAPPGSKAFDLVMEFLERPPSLGPPRDAAPVAEPLLGLVGEVEKDCLHLD